MHQGRDERPPAVNVEFDGVPAPEWGSAMRCHEDAEGRRLIFAEAPGLLRSPPALRLMAVGVIFLLLGLFVVGAAAVGSLREFEAGSILAFLVGGSVGSLILWIGVMVVRWAAAAAWGITEIIVTSEALHVRRSGRRPWLAEVSRADFCGILVTDQLGMVNELLAMAKGHRVVRVLSGRSAPELLWLATLIKSQLGADGMDQRDEEVLGHGESDAGEGVEDDTLGDDDGDGD